MKKLLIFLAIVVIIIAIIFTQYYGYKVEKNTITQENEEYEKYLDQEIYGLEIGTIMNKTIDNNNKNQVQKDEQGIYQQNDTNSIEIEIYIKDNDTTYKMETFYNAGTEQFVQYYGNIKFKCSKIDYHEKSKRVKYLLFEQV